MLSDNVELNWRTAQAKYHGSRGRLLMAYAAAYESEAHSCKDERRRKYLMTKARQFRKDAELRFEKSAKLSQPLAA